MRAADRQLRHVAGLRLVQLGLRTLGFRRTVRLLGGKSPRTQPSEYHFPAAESAAETVRRATGRPYTPTCLDRSVYLWYLLHRNWVDAHLRIGVDYQDGVLTGHAWVEVNGAVVNDEPDIASRYEVFADDAAGIALR